MDKHCLLTTVPKLESDLYVAPACKSSRDSNGALNPIALRKAKIVCNFGLSECKRVNNS